jgi:hypothetical protein
MTAHPLALDRTGQVVIEPAIPRVYPSVARVWHGAKITVFIETRWVPDGTSVRLELFQGESSTPLLEIEERATIEKNRASLEWTVDLSEEKVGGALRTRGASHEMFIVASIDELGGPTGRSSPLYVDLTPYVISF